jgi:hypothetical protein
MRLVLVTEEIQSHQGKLGRYVDPVEISGRTLALLSGLLFAITSIGEWCVQRSKKAYRGWRDHDVYEKEKELEH